MLTIRLLGLTLLLTVAALALSAATPARAAPSTTTYVARAEAGGPLLALVVAETRATAFVADERGAGVWLRGSVRDGVAALASEDGAAQLSAQLSATDARAALTWQGRSSDVAAPAVTDAGPAGLYAGTSGGMQAAWVLLPDGHGGGTVTRAGVVLPAPLWVLPASSIAWSPAGGSSAARQTLELTGPSYRLSLARVTTAE